MRLIDGDALYKELNAIRKEEVLLHGRSNNKDCCTLSTALYEIEHAPTIEPEPKWIPCSERLPEAEEKHYWVCTDTGYQCQCRWTNVNHIWTQLTTEWHWHIMDIPQYSKVIAWMKLPEPWKEGEK